MFCLITDLMDIREYPARDLAALYKWRWDGSETALREAKSALDGAGSSAGPMLRSGTPGLARQELAAWAAAVEMTRGVGRRAALAAAPARKGRRAGQPVQPREISHTAARRAVIAAIRCGEDQLHRPDQHTRKMPHGHRPEPAPRPQGEIAQRIPYTFVLASSACSVSTFKAIEGPAGRASSPTESTRQAGHIRQGQVHRNAAYDGSVVFTHDHASTG